MMLRSKLTIYVLLVCGWVAGGFSTGNLYAQAAGNPDASLLEIDQELGETIDLDLSFFDEKGQKKTLREVINKPTVLTLVYYRCPGICTPVLNEVTRAASLSEVEPGTDYQLVTISFDHREMYNPDEPAFQDLAKNKKNAMIRYAHSEYEKEIPPASWTFMTGDEANIQALTRNCGFPFKPDKQDFIHPATVIFLTKDGKIVRYLGGLKILPMEFKMAVVDANAGRPGMVMQKIQRLCFAYDPEGKGYLLKVDRIVLAIGVLTLAGFGSFLFFKGKPKNAPAERGERKQQNIEG